MLLDAQYLTASCHCVLCKAEALQLEPSPCMPTWGSVQMRRPMTVRAGADRHRGSRLPVLMMTAQDRGKTSAAKADARISCLESHLNGNS